MRRAIVLTTAVAVLVGAPLMAAGASEQDPIEQARQAAAQTSFSGTLVLQWRDGAVLHTEQVQVQGTGGNLVVKGRRSAMALKGERLVYQPGGWALVWPSGLAPRTRPQMASAYQVAAAPSEPVAGYAARAVEVRKDGVVRERFYFEEKTSLLLRRVQFAEDGQLERAFTFRQVRIQDPSVVEPSAPPVSRDVPDEVGLSSGANRLAAGYQRLGAVKDAGVVHVLYGDGFYELSLFEQHGRLDRAKLPAHARPVRLSKGRRAWSGPRDAPSTRSWATPRPRNW